MVWNTDVIDIPDGVMKNRPLLSVDTAKQSFYDFILNMQVVGYEEVEGKTEDEPPTPIIKSVLVHGNYQDIYNKLMNASLVIGACISLLTEPNSTKIGQTNDVVTVVTNIVNVAILNNVINPITNLPATIGGMPLIEINEPGFNALLDCQNQVWFESEYDSIPFDS